jgi:branched-chain amino acid transport system substrate-binding protein
MYLASNRCRALGLAVISLVIVSSCSEPEVRHSPRGASPSKHLPGDKSGNLAGREASDYREIQKLYSSGSYEATIQKITVFEKKYPRSEQMSHVLNLNGLAYLLTKRPLQASVQFKKSIGISTDNEFKQFVLFNLAVTQFELGNNEETQQTLSEIRPEGLDTDTKIKFYSLRAKLFDKLALPLEAAREILTLSKIIDENELRSGPYTSQLEQYLRTQTEMSAVEALYKEYEDAPLADVVLFRLGTQAYGSGQVAVAETRLRELVSRFPRSSHYSEASSLIDSLRSNSEVDTFAVGVLLPMKGKFAKFGEQALHAVEMAFHVYDNEDTGPKVTLVIEDSGEDGDQAVKALDELFFKHRVSAVVGPLLSKGIDKVTQRAEDLGLPIVTLAQQPGINGRFVFPVGLTIKQQAFEIARYAVEDLGLRRFAIMHPKSKFGEQYSQNYWDAVETYGGKIVGVESYAADETDFRRSVDRLSGLYYTEARHRELEDLAKEREKNNITKRNRKTEQFFALKPIVDYDAVFIPEEPKTASQIIPTFAYRDVDHIKFLGTSNWNSQEFITRAQGYAEGAVFVDAFYPGSQSPLVKSFVTQYKSTFDQDPSLIEAQAYDGASLVYRAIITNGARGRMNVRDDLKNLDNFKGITGKISYRDNQLYRTLTVLTVKGGKIEEVRQ